MVKTSRGIGSMAAAIGAAVFLMPTSVAAQDATFDCPPGSTRPTSGVTPYAGSLCDLGSLSADNSGNVGTSGLLGQYSLVVSADGTVIVGESEMGDGNVHAFRWVNDGKGMQDLGTLSPRSARADSRAYGVSADGSVIVGQASLTEHAEIRAFRWVNDGKGMRDLGTLVRGGRGNSSALAVSADGAVIVGYADDNNGRIKAFSWRDDGKGMIDLRSLGADNQADSYASLVSADGTVIVGQSDTHDGKPRAFLWQDRRDVGHNSNLTDLGSLRADNLGTSTATAMNTDGMVIVGHAETDDGSAHAFRWTGFDREMLFYGNEMLDLGTLRAGNSGSSHANAISADGSVIVGRSDTNDNAKHAFRWMDNGKGMQDLGTLRADNSGSSTATAISADSTVIIGQSHTDDNAKRAFRWVDDGKGMQDLGTLRADNSGNSMARSISADGSIIVGESDGDGAGTRMFIWRTQMQDYEKLIYSFDVPANDTEIAVAQQQAIADRMMSSICISGAGRICLQASGDIARTGSDLGDDIGAQASTIGQLSLGYGVSDNFTIGGAVSLGGTDISNNSFDMGTSKGASLWANYSATGLARTGLQASAAIGYGQADGDLLRGRGIDNVMLATGETELSTTSARASLGYGIQAQDWLITPRATLSHYSTNRSAYAETGSDFDASYDDLSTERTTMALEVRGEYKISTRSTMLFGAGFERDLQIDPTVIKGTSTLPGMESFAVTSALPRNTNRGFALVGYSQGFGENSTLSGVLKVGQGDFGNKAKASVNVTYGMRF